MTRKSRRSGAGCSSMDAAHAIGGGAIARIAQVKEGRAAGGEERRLPRRAAIATGLAQAGLDQPHVGRDRGVEIDEAVIAGDDERRLVRDARALRRLDHGS